MLAIKAVTPGLLPSLVYEGGDRAHFHTGRTGCSATGLAPRPGGTALLELGVVAGAELVVETEHLERRRPGVGLAAQLLERSRHDDVPTGRLLAEPDPPAAAVLDAHGRVLRDPEDDSGTTHLARRRREQELRDLDTLRRHLHRLAGRVKRVGARVGLLLVLEPVTVGVRLVGIRVVLDGLLVVAETVHVGVEELRVGTAVVLLTDLPVLERAGVVAEVHQVTVEVVHGGHLLHLQAADRVDRVLVGGGARAETGVLGVAVPVQVVRVVDVRPEVLVLADVEVSAGGLEHRLDGLLRGRGRHVQAEEAHEGEQ